MTEDKGLNPYRGVFDDGAHYVVQAPSKRKAVGKLKAWAKEDGRESKLISVRRIG